MLVGDSVGMVVHGLPNTVGVTMEMMIMHGQAVMRAARRALVVVDMPFGSYEGDVRIAYNNASRIMKETGAQAVKVESGETVPETIDYLVKRGIPVMGHVGLQPQSVHALGGFKMQGRGIDAAAKIVADAKALEEAGAYALVLEAIPPDVARQVTAAVGIPTIGIGAGPGCDGQVLVCTDLLGMSRGHAPKFAKRFAELGDAVVNAAAEYVAEVRSGTFPSVEHSFKPNRVDETAVDLTKN
jgi:3-methyl-2-oxobutanoate hydroxymethyltransferase